MLQLGDLFEARTALVSRNSRPSGEGLAVPWFELPEISPAAHILALPVTLEALSVAFHEVWSLSVIIFVIKPYVITYYLSNNVRHFQRRALLRIYR